MNGAHILLVLVLLREHLVRLIADVLARLFVISRVGATIVRRVARTIAIGGLVVQIASIRRQRRHLVLLGATVLAGRLVLVAAVLGALARRPID